MCDVGGNRRLGKLFRSEAIAVQEAQVTPKIKILGVEKTTRNAFIPSLFRQTLRGFLHYFA